MSKRWISGLLAAACLWGVAGTVSFAQDAAAPAAPAAAGAGGMELSKDAQAAAAKDKKNPMSFLNVVMSSGFLGVVLWLGLGACSVAGFALIVDSFVTIREKKIVPAVLVEKARSAMEQGDVMKAIHHCEESPGPLANILSAGFSNVQEGFEAVQEAIGVAADMETEKLIQRITYLNVEARFLMAPPELETVIQQLLAGVTAQTTSDSTQSRVPASGRSCGFGAVGEVTLVLPP